MVELQEYFASLVKVSAIGTGIGLIIVKLNVHMAIHVIGLLLATLLAVVSCNSYYRDRRPKILLLAIAFILLDLQQFMELSESFLSLKVNVPVPLLGIELSHLISFATVAFLAAGVLRKE